MEGIDKSDAALEFLNAAVVEHLDHGRHFAAYNLAAVAAQTTSETPIPSVELKRIAKWYGSGPGGSAPERHILDGLDLVIAPGERFACRRPAHHQ